MSWDHRYRQLEEGEIVLSTDEVLNDSDLKWYPAKGSVGKPAPAPGYIAHRMIRRLK